MQPKAYISYSPGKMGSVFALFYCEAGTDLHGWHIEARDSYFSAAFFMVEGFYATEPPRLYRSVEDDAYGPWIIDYPPTKDEIRCPLPDSAVHELERMQSLFVQEWLFFGDDPGLETEIAAYREHGLGVHEVNIRSRKLHRLHPADANWTYMTPGTDPNVVQLLRKYWRLSEKIPAP
jgi:hypothetical protein